MSGLQKLAKAGIEKIAGTKDPIRVIEAFIKAQGAEVAKTRQEDSEGSKRWLLPTQIRGSSVENEKGQKIGEDLEILFEERDDPCGSVIYLAYNASLVPLRGSNDFLISALEVADGLNGCKVSLVGHYLVISATINTSSLSIDQLKFHQTLLSSQLLWFREEMNIRIEGGDRGRREGDKPQAEIAPVVANSEAKRAV